MEFKEGVICRNQNIVEILRWALNVTWAIKKPPSNYPEHLATALQLFFSCCFFFFDLQNCETLIIV